MKSDIILKMLIDGQGEPVSGEQISSALGISRTAVWKHIQSLLKSGYNIKSVPTKGYSLLFGEDILRREAIIPLLNNKKFEIIVRDTVGSTNTEARVLAPTQHGDCVILARAQTEGRGRLGRNFVSTCDMGIYLSFLLHTDITVDKISMVPIISAIAVLRTLKQQCNLAVGIKWPNDILVSGKKLCGILTEAAIEAESGKVEYCVAGLGINLYGSSADFGPDLSSKATTVEASGGISANRNRIAAALVNEFNELFLEICGPNHQLILSEYRSNMLAIGQRAHICSASEDFDAVIRGIDDNGRLIVEMDDGSERVLASGEVTLCNYYN